MVHLLIDENFNHRMLRGLRLRLPGVSYTLVQETEVFQQDDPQVLAYAAEQQFVLLTHDVNTMTKYAYDRLAAEQAVPGVIIVPRLLPIGEAIEELVLVLECTIPEEFENQVLHLPL